MSDPSGATNGDWDRDDIETLDCGCRIGTVSDTFVIEPCSLTCQWYLYVVAETQRQGKPISHLEMP